MHSLPEIVEMNKERSKPVMLKRVITCDDWNTKELIAQLLVGGHAVSKNNSIKQKKFFVTIKVEDITE